MVYPATYNQPFATHEGWQLPSAPPREVVLQTVGLTKVYGKRQAIKGLHLEVARGEVFGFLGPNGVGKTTTIRMLLGLIKPTFGEVRLFGERLGEHPRRLLPRVGARTARVSEPSQAACQPAHAGAQSLACGLAPSQPHVAARQAFCGSSAGVVAGVGPLALRAVAHPTRPLPFALLGGIGRGG